MDRKSVSLLAVAAMAGLGVGIPHESMLSLNNYDVPWANVGWYSKRGPGRGHPKRYTYTRKNKRSSRARCQGRL